jgi:anti-sigma factor ChrR (cupin superfamily)
MKLLPSCHEVQSLATEFKEGALPWPKALGIRIHLLFCWACRAFLKGLEALPRIARRALSPGAEPPAAASDTLASVLKQIRR